MKRHINMKQTNVKNPCYLAVRRELADIFIDLNKEVWMTVGLIVSGIMEETETQ